MNVAHAASNVDVLTADNIVLAARNLALKFIWPLQV
jgi:hypothetical protein